MAATYLIELDGKDYEFNPGKEITLAEYEYMEDAFGEQYGGWFGFRRQLTEFGNHKSIRCLVWLVQRHREGFKGIDPAAIDVPVNFEPGQFLEDIRNKDALDQQEAAKNAAADPLDNPSATSEQSTHDGTGQPAEFEAS